MYMKMYLYNTILAPRNIAKFGLAKRLTQLKMHFQKIPFIKVSLTNFGSSIYIECVHM